MKILVTGGNGYVGRELCNLLHQDHEVCVVDNLRYGSLRLDVSDMETLRFEHIDISDAAAVQACIADFEPDAIIHLAAVHYIPECENDPALAVRTNVTGTVNLLEACPEGCRFVFASSGAVYLPEATPHTEHDSPLAPSDVYGYSKYHGEQYVRYLAATRNFPAVIVRLFNVAGPGETNPHVIPEIVAQLKAGRTVLELGNRSPQRDYIHVKDAARGFTTVATTGAVENGETVVVNLGTSQTASVDDLLSMLREVSGIPFEVRTDPSRFRRSDRPYLAADRSEIKRLFGWAPEYSVRDAVSDIWQDPDLPEVLLQKYAVGVPDAV